MAQIKNPLIYLISCSLRSKGKWAENSNSEIALSAAKLGVQKLSSWVISIRLTEDNLEKVAEDIIFAKGLIFGTPVYFGSGSSLMFELFDILKKKKISLYKKVVGFAIVGAKRNGGQETTLMLSAWKAMGLGAIVVNDGAPVSQFGGTCVAGMPGTVIKDVEGLKMAKSLGERVASTAQILSAGNTKERVILRKWNSKRFLKYYNIKRCIACLNCPTKVKDDYKCILKDEMMELHPWLMETNGVIPQGHDMKFWERTRYLRRDNYRLTYHVAQMNDIRHIPIFIKENAILCRKYLKQYAKLITSGRRLIKFKTQTYEAVGH